MGLGVDEVEWIPKDLHPILEKEGIHTLVDLVLTPKPLLKSSGLSDPELSYILERACIALHGLRGPQALQRTLDRPSISTGSSSLDRLLGGGARKGLVTDFFGGSGTGKTQLCFQLCVNESASVGKGECAVFVDTTNTFRPERITEMAEERGLDADRVLGKIFVIRARSVKEQVQVPKGLNELVGMKVGLLIVDGLTNNFIFEYVGGERIIERQSTLARYLQGLRTAAIDRGIAVVVTNSVRVRITPSEGWYEVEAGGNVVSQGVHVSIHLFKDQYGLNASLIQPPVPKPVARFSISPKGIV